MALRQVIAAISVLGLALIIQLTYLNRPRPPMPSLVAARASNSAWKPNYARPTALFFGGTSGIGQAMAERFVNQTQGNAHIILLGRNQEAAQKIISGFPKHANSVYEFEKVDATSMKDVRRVTTKLSSRLEKVNFIVASTGFLSMAGRTENGEGLDKKMAVNVYGRYRFIENLLPKLEKAVEQGEDARVMTVLAAGRGNGYINLDDMGLKKEYSLRNAESAVVIYSDALITAWASKHPKISFTHTFPGFVTTPMVTEFHWTMKYIVPLFRFMSVTPAECAEYMLFPLWSSEGKFKTGAHRLDNHAEPVKPNAALNDNVTQVVWDHVNESTK